MLYAVSEALNSAKDVQEALKQTLALVAGLLGRRTAGHGCLTPQTGQFSNAAAQNLPPYLQQPVRMTGHSCWCLSAFRDGQLSPRNVAVIECSRLCPAVEAGLIEATAGLRFHASIPLYCQEKPPGRHERGRPLLA